MLLYTPCRNETQQTRLQNVMQSVVNTILWKSADSNKSVSFVQPKGKKRAGSKGLNEVEGPLLPAPYSNTVTHINSVVRSRMSLEAICVCNKKVQTEVAWTCVEQCNADRVKSKI